MIGLFNINTHTLDTSRYTNLLHDNIVTEFEDSIKNYVGAKYAVSFNSATSAIFLSLLNKNTILDVPSMIPPVVLNAIVTSGNKYTFNDNTDLMVFSFYPTKPVGGSDGGIIVSNDIDKITLLKEMALNGMTYSHNNWERKIRFPGYKMYMNSIQADIAMNNFNLYEEKLSSLKKIRDIYNNKLGYSNTSNHLYRIEVDNRENFIEYMKTNGVWCGIHYEAAHLNSVYSLGDVNCPLSEKKSLRTVSIPFHERLTISEVNLIINKVKEYREK